jgi:adenylosuccinate synthase
VGYDIDGKVTKDFPVNYLLEKAKPVLIKMPGWKQDIRGIKSFEDLPENCRNYVLFIEKELEIPVTIVTNGPKRDEYILKGFH